MNETASVVELLAVLVNLTGIWAAGRMLQITLRRYDAVKRQPDRFPTGRELMAAHRHFRCESGRIAMHAGALCLGLWAMTLPQGDSWYGFAAQMFRLLIGLLFTVLSAMDLRTDTRLWAMMSRTASTERKL